MNVGGTKSWITAMLSGLVAGDLISPRVNSSLTSQNNASDTWFNIFRIK